MSLFFKKMKNFIKEKRLQSLLIVFAILIPLFVFAEDQNSGFRLIAGTTKTVSYNNASGSLNPIRACISNVDSVDYFVPTRTNTEWSAFSNNFLFQKSFVTSNISYQNPAPGTYPLRWLSCATDGYCNTYSENCSNDPAECGACPACSYIYSAWSGCSSGGIKIRSISYQGPANCVGTPESLSTACCTGCPSSAPKCTNYSVYNTSYCSGTLLHSETNICYDGSSFNSCINAGSNVSMKYTYPSGSCYYDCATPPKTYSGCPAGSTCRSATVRYPSSNCTGPIVQSITSTCADNNTLNNVCQSMSTTNDVGVTFTPGSGCSYTTN